MMRRGDMGGGGPAAAIDHNVKLLRARAMRMQNLQRPAVVTAEKVREQIDRAYAEKRDPHGDWWKPLRYRREPPPMLQLTGKSRRSIRLTASRGAVRYYAVDYLFVHMRGRHITRRNPTPFYFKSGRWHWRAELQRAHRRRIREWIETGQVTS